MLPTVSITPFASPEVPDVYRMATVSCIERAVGEDDAPFEEDDATVLSALKISSNNTKRGASGQAASMASRSTASPQQIKRGSASRSIAASSPAAWRAYIGTAMSPSAIMARSRAAQRMLFGATSAQRSPFENPEARKKARAAAI